MCFSCVNGACPIQRRAFGAHVREGRGAAVHPHRHEMAADASGGAAAFGHAGRGVVRAARAEVGLADGRYPRLGERLLLEIEIGEPFLELTPQSRSHVQLHETLRYRLGDDRRIVLVVRRKEPGSRGLAVGTAPFAVVVELAYHARRALAGFPGVELFLDLVLDQLALFFHHQDLFQPLREAARALRLERPGHRDLVDPQADVARDGFIDAEVRERLHGVAEAFAGGDEAQLRVGAIPDDPIQAVGAHIGERRVNLPVEQPRFLVQDAVRPTDVQPVFRQDEVGRHFHLYAIRVHDHRGARLDHVSDAFEGDPQARVAAHGVAVQAEIQVVLHVRRAEHRNAAGLEDVLALVRERRGFCGVVIPRQHQHPAVLRSARSVRVLEDIAAAVYAGALAVPHAEYAVVFRAREHVQLLRAPDRGRGEVFIYAGLELHVVRRQVGLRAPQRLIEPAERRAAIAGNEACGVQARPLVAFALQQQEANQCLGAGEEYAALVQCVLVVEGNPGEGGGVDWGVHGSVSSEGTVSIFLQTAARRLVRAGTVRAAFSINFCGWSQYGSGPKDSAR